MYACMTKTNGIVFLHVIEVLIAILTIFPFCIFKLLISMRYCMIVSMASSPRAPKHVWTKEEEARSSPRSLRAPKHLSLHSHTGEVEPLSHLVSSFAAIDLCLSHQSRAKPAFLR